MQIVSKQFDGSYITQPFAKGVTVTQLRGQVGSLQNMRAIVARKLMLN